MQSEEFDTYLMLGQMVRGEFQTLEIDDDGGDSGTNSRLEYIPATGGRYVVVFTAFAEGEMGAYSFALQ